MWLALAAAMRAFSQGFACRLRLALAISSRSLLVLSQMMRWGQVDYSEQAVRMVSEVYRADLLADATGFPGVAAGRDHAPLMDGRYFDPGNVRRKRPPGKNLEPVNPPLRVLSQAIGKGPARIDEKFPAIAGRRARFF